MSILTVNITSAGYDGPQVLKNVVFGVQAGMITAIIGPNGSGKSTVLKTIMNMLPKRTAAISLEEKDISHLTTEKLVKEGISFSPQGNRVFDELTVRENLEVGGYLLKKKEMELRLEEMLVKFPRLRERLKADAATLSGGEKQQLAIARTLMLKPKVLMLDEPSLGLSPDKIDDAMELISNLRKESGMTFLIVEQKVQKILSIADRVLAMRGGEIFDTGTPEEMRQGEKLKKIFLL